MITENLKKMHDIRNGARFFKVDLHFHTPASHDYRDKSIPYMELVTKAITCGLDMVAVTDHNIGIGYEEMLKAAKGTGLVVLPGVEITVEGIHILGIFPEKKDPSDIVYLLHNLKIKDEDMGKKETIAAVELSIPQVLQEILKAGGIPIAAHVGGHKGLAKEIKGRWRTALVQHEALKILEITRNEDKTFFDGSDPVYKRKLTCVRSSDAHHPDEIGQRATWIKMGECSFRGLKQIIYEPDLRVSLEQPRPQKQPKIIGMTCTGGLYKDEVFHFNNNLNCIIGGRGAGKSAIVDFIRYALRYPPRSKGYLRAFNERIVKLLGIGNSVTVYIENEEGIFAISRELKDYIPERISGKEEKVKKIIAEQRIYQITDGQLIELHKNPRELIEIEVFGQGEVFELTRRADDQLNLIDEYVGAEELFEKEKIHMQDLRINAKSIVQLESDIFKLRTELSELRPLKDEIKSLERELKGEAFKNHALWQTEHRFFMEVRKNLDQERDKAKSNIDEIICPELPPIKENLPNFSILTKVSELFKDLYQDLGIARKTDFSKVNQVIGEVDNTYREWRKDYDSNEQEFNRKLVELGVRDQRTLSKRLEELRDEEFRLEKKVLPRYKQTVEVRDKSLKRRKDLLHNLEDLRDEIHKRRQRVVTAMSEQLEKGDVKIEVNRGENKTLFFDLLNKIYTGSDIRNREKQLEKICTSYTPLELAKLIRDKDVDKLTRTFHITSDTAEKIVDTANSEDIFEIQICPLKDELVVYLRKAEGEEFSPLTDLSYGEKCTAVFSIALIGEQKPLLVDQPEDELDHAFVIKNIVEHIRNRKEARQLIVCTHNANIPVLGDAELIFKVTKVPGELKCRVEEKGAFEEENIINRLQDLEGGPEAFQKRKEKYGV